MTDSVRWTLSISKETDVTLRTFLARSGLKKGDLSKTRPVKDGPTLGAAAPSPSAGVPLYLSFNRRRSLCRSKIHPFAT
jgi:hypothetical protein